ncbi:MAG: double zinc ribbon domain-containing protein [Candidatus Fimivivens sp.]|nr:double zinc ribbon domain-containing protein [Candidatus Fimivivens sp.]
MKLLHLNVKSCLDLFFPPRCAVCREVTPIGTALCPECMQFLPEKLFDSSRCLVCGKPVDSCVCRGDEPFYFSRSVSAFFYEHDTHYLINCLKTQPQSPALEQVAALMAEAITAFGFSGDNYFDAVTEVPMSAANIEKRGHNQAKTLAEKLATRLNISYMPSPLICDVKKQAQHTLTYTQRFENAQKSYQRQAGATCAGRILLIDDVMTTGATLDRCAQLLRQCGATEVCCLTACTTLRRGDLAAVP